MCCSLKRQFFLIFGTKLQVLDCNPLTSFREEQGRVSTAYTVQCSDSCHLAEKIIERLDKPLMIAVIVIFQFSVGVR